MVQMRAGSSSPIDAAHTGSMGSTSFRSASSHRWGTLVSGLARFTWDLTSATSIVSLYSTANSSSVLSRHLINISDAALVRTLAFLDRVSEIHQCTQAESVCRWITLAFQCSARLMPLNTASSSTRLMCLSACTSRSQLASSMMAPSYSIATPVARELASTRTVTSWPSVHQSPHAGSVCDDLITISSNIRCNMESCVSLSHPVVTALALRFTNAAATWSHPHTGKCPDSRPHTEKMAWRVSTLGTFGRSLSHRHLSLPRSSQTYMPNTRAPPLSCSGFLQVSPNRSRCVFTWAAEHTLSLTNMSSTYEEVARLTVSSCTITAFTMDRIICGATLSPNPKRVRQYLCPLIFTIWNGHNDLSTWICKYARRRSTMAAFGPHGLSTYIRIRRIRIHVLIQLAIVHNLLLTFRYYGH